MYSRLPAKRRRDFNMMLEGGCPALDGYQIQTTARDSPVLRPGHLSSLDDSDKTPVQVFRDVAEMDFRRLKIDGLVEVVPQKFRDERGYFSEVFRQDEFARHVSPVGFVQENQSTNILPGTIRGIHFQVGSAAQGKLVRCLAGKLFDVAVDLRQGSATFGEWLSLVLTPEDNNQLWIPVGFGHAFCSLEPNSVISYKVTNYYSAEYDAGVIWDDVDIGIDWPTIANPDSLSAKDRNLPRLANLPAYFSQEAS
jgi:dTDP-4-dehydrorhamnose 3,5-epimerase